LAQLATVVIVGQVSLMASALLLPLVSEYSLVGDTMSELVLGRYGWVQTAAFVAAGIGTLALAYAIREMTRGTWGSRVGSLLVGVYGVGALLVAVFPTDRVDRPEDIWAQSTTGLIHVAVSLVSFVVMVIAMFVLTRTFLLDARWQSFSRWMVLFPTAALSLLIAQSSGPWAGIMQRLLVGVIAVWIVVIALKIRSLAVAAQSEAAPESGAAPAGAPSLGVPATSHQAAGLDRAAVRTGERQRVGPELGSAG
jgi:hypothetical protein